MFSGIGAQEVLLIFLIILLLFGSRRIPEVGRSLGKGIREFKAAARELGESAQLDDDKPMKKPAPPAESAPREAAAGPAPGEKKEGEASRS